MEWLLFLAISLTLLYACYTDILWRRITNRTTILILLLSLLAGYFSPEGPSFLLPAALFLVGFIVATLGVIGAGDIKLLCALTVALPPSAIGDFLLFTAMAGIPLTLLTLLYYRLFLRDRQATLPYGIAIAAGYWLQWGSNLLA